MTLPRLTPTGQLRPRPRILQFGGGNFLRGFLDWKIDRLNAATGSDWGIVILRSVGGTEGSALNAQGGLYTVVSRGLGADGQPQSEARLVTSVLEEISCSAEWDRVLGLARDPAIEVVVSNTTEAGIVYQPAAFDAAPPASFPAKLARLMAERWRAGGAGWHVLPCELTQDAGDRLAEIVRRHAQDWDMEPQFMNWLQQENRFFNTLVDRIVTGHPGAEAARIAEALGYDDACLTTAELFHLLVIETPPDRPAFRLRLADHDPGTLEVPDAGPYRLRKVAILNGGHTALCPLAMICGVATVGEAVSDPALRGLLLRVLDQEIKPFVPLPAADLDAFADEVLRRFGNPYIAHRWHDISLNGLAKFRDRVMERMLAYQARAGRPAPVLSLSLAGWLVFYTRGFAGAGALPPRDAPEVLARIAALTSRLDQVEAFLAEPAFWGRSLAEPALVKAVTEVVDLLSRPGVTSSDLIAALG